MKNHSISKEFPFIHTSYQAFNSQTPLVRHEKISFQQIASSVTQSHAAYSLAPLLTLKFESSDAKCLIKALYCIPSFDPNDLIAFP